MPERLATGEVVINLRDEALIAGLDRAQAKYHATMAALDREEAKIRVDLDSKGFDDGIKKLRAEKKAIESELLSIHPDQSDSKKISALMKEDLRTLEAELKNLESQKLQNDRIIGARRELLQIDAFQANQSQKRFETDNKLLTDRLRLEKQQAAQRANEQRELYQLKLPGERAEEERRRREVTSDRDHAAALREAARLRDQFAKKTDEIEKRERTKTGFIDFLSREEKVKVDLDTGAARADLKLLEEEMKLKGIDIPAHIKVDERDIKDFFLNLPNKLKAATGSGFRVPLPFTSLRAPAGALAAAAPLLASVAGGITSLAGVTGAGALGAGAVGGGVLGGLVGNFAGIAAAIVPVKKEMEQLTKSTEKYEKAVKEYGKGSKQAVIAQAELNEVLRHTPKLLVEGQRQWEEVSDKFIKDTSGIRDALGRVISDAAKAGKELEPIAAKNSTATANILAAGFGRFSRNLSSPKEAEGLDQLGKSANDFLKPALEGVEGFTKALLHIGESAARLFGGPLGKWIQDLGQDFEKATKPGNKLDEKIRILGKDAQDVGKFFIAFGKVITTALGLAAPQGDKLANTMTGALTRWDSKLKDDQGRKGFQTFIRESDEALEKLGPVLEAVLKLFGSWAIGLLPAVKTVTEFFKGVTDVVNGLGKLLGLQSGVQSLGVLIGVLFAANKALAFAAALSKVYAIMKGMAALGAAGDLTGALQLPLATRAGGAAAKKAEEDAAKAVEQKGGGSLLAKLLAGGAGAAGGGIGIRGILAALGSSGAVVGGGLALGALGLQQVTHLGPKGIEFGADTGGSPPRHAGEELHKFHEASKLAAQGTGELTGQVLQSNLTFHQAELSVSRAREAIHLAKPGTVEYKEAILAYKSAVLQANEAERQRATIIREIKADSSAGVSAVRARKKVLEESIAASKNAFADPEKEDPTFNKREKERAEAAKELVELLNKQEVAILNIKRAYKNLEPITEPEGVNALGSLARKPGGQPLAQKIALQFPNPVDAVKVAKGALDAINRGTPMKVVVKAVGDTKSAHDALAQLASAAKTNTDKINDVVRNALKLTKKLFHDGAGNAVSAFMGGFQGFVGGYKGIWTGMENVTRTALKNINKVLLQELKVLNGGKVPTLAEGGPPLAPGVEKQLQSEKGHAAKGLIQYGRAGDKGGDNIATRMVVGSGEVGAVFTGHQQKVANEYLAPIGGLSGLFKNVNKPHYQMASGGLIHAATGYSESYGGRKFSKPELERLWDRAGGNPGQAHLMAAIALAESKGYSGASNTAGAHGLWQIKGNPFPGNEFDPLTNARMAVSKLKSQGLGAWEVYTNGSYRQYLDSKSAAAVGAAAGGPGGAGHPFKPIPKQKIPLHGLVGAVVTAGVERVRKAANKTLKKFANSLGGEGPGGLFSGPTPAGTSIPNTAWNPSHKPIANWIVPILRWAAAHGWRGSVSSGYRSFAEQAQINAEGKFSAAAGSSNHEFANYPGGAVDVSDDYGLERVLSRYPRSPKLIGHKLGAIDPEHFSATGKARGGLVKRPALLVGEHEHEWVINPHRADNHAYLKEAGEEMGYHVTPAKKGKPSFSKTFKAKGKIPDTSWANLRAIPAELIKKPLEEVEANLKAEKAAYHKLEVKRDKAIDALKDSKDSAARSLAKTLASGNETVQHARSRAGKAESKATEYYVAPGMPNPAKKTAEGAAEGVSSAERARDRKVRQAEASAKGKIGKAEKKLKEIEKGLKVTKDGGVFEHTQYIPWRVLERQQHKGREAVAALEAKEAQVTNLNKTIGSETHLLNILQGRYGHKGSDKKAIEGEWNKTFGVRQGNIEELKKIIKDSEGKAKSFEKLHPSAAIHAFLEGVAGELEGIEDKESEAEGQQEVFSEASKTKTEAPTGEQFAESQGMLASIKEAEERYALSQAAARPDDPNTPQNEELPYLKKELVPASDIKGLWEGALEQAQRLQEPVSTITELANTVTGARSTVFGLEQTIQGAEKDVTTVKYAEAKEFGNQRYELLKNFGSNFAPIAVAPGISAAASISGALTPTRSGTLNSQPQVGKTVNLEVNNHYQQPPANPHHWSKGVEWELGAII
jgi:hypothetical protein